MSRNDNYEQNLLVSPSSSTTLSATVSLTKWGITAIELVNCIKKWWA